MQALAIGLLCSQGLAESSERNKVGEAVLIAARLRDDLRPQVTQVRHSTGPDLLAEHSRANRDLDGFLAHG